MKEFEPASLHASFHPALPAAQGVPPYTPIEYRNSWSRDLKALPVFLGAAHLLP